MALFPRKNLLAIAVVIDVALLEGRQRVLAKELTRRHGLPARHLEPVLQALVREGILKGVRGRQGGYQLARAQNQITAGEILQALGTIDDHRNLPKGKSLAKDVVRPALVQAEKSFFAELAKVRIDMLVHRSKSWHPPKKRSY
jgi:Rrf2 family protein